MAKVQKYGSVTVKIECSRVRVVVPFFVTAEKADMKSEFAAAKEAVMRSVKITPPKRVPMENCKITFPKAE